MGGPWQIASATSSETQIPPSFYLFHPYWHVISILRVPSWFQNAAATAISSVFQEVGRDGARAKGTPPSGVGPLQKLSGVPPSDLSLLLIGGYTYISTGILPPQSRVLVLERQLAGLS